LADIPGTGNDLYIRVQNPDDASCYSTVAVELPNCCANDLGLITQCEPVVQHWTKNFIGYTNLISFKLFGITYTPPSPIDITDISALNAWFGSLGLEVYVLWNTGLSMEPQINVFPPACTGILEEDFFEITVDPEPSAYLEYVETLTCEDAQLIIPSIVCPSCCDCYVAIPSGVASNIDDDIIEYSTDGGGIWLPYTYPDCINPADYLPAQEVIFRRTVTFTTACPPVVITEIINACNECSAEITGIEVSGLLPCDEFHLYDADDVLPGTSVLLNVTILGITYTPSSPIPATDIDALRDFMNSLVVFAKFHITDSGVGYTNIQMVTGCGDPITGTEYQYDNGIGAVDVHIEAEDSLPDLTCEGVPIPDFDCNVGCSETGMVDITVNFTACGASGSNMLVELSGGFGAGNIPIVTGTATFTNIPAYGQTITVSIWDPEQEECIDSRDITLPDCSIPYGMEVYCFTNGCNEDSYFAASFGAKMSPSQTVTSFTISGVVYTPGTPLEASDTAGILAYLNSLGLPFTFFVKHVAGLNAFSIMMASNYCCELYNIANFEVAIMRDVPGIMTAIGGYYTCSEIQTTIPAFMCCPEECFSVTPIGFSGASILVDVIEHSFNGIDWFIGSIACIHPGSEVYFRRSITFDGEDPIVITYKITNFEHCGCYDIVDMDTEEVIGGEDDCE